MAEACTQKLCKHHVVPEIKEVKQQTENDDDTEHQHVLASPLYFLWLCCYLVTLVTASTTVLCCQDESVNDVTNCQSCQTQSCNYGVPVSTQQLADCVVSFSREKRNHIHATVECQE